MRIFASDWVRKMMDRLGMEEDIPIESQMVSKSIERAQTQVEGRNFEIRKHLLEYDDVMNKQRVAVYKLRRQILEGSEGRNYILRVIDEVVGSLIDEFCPEEADPEDWDRDALAREYRTYFGLTTDQIGVDWDAINRPDLEESDQNGRRRPLPDQGRRVRRSRVFPSRKISFARHRRSAVEGPPAGP